MPSKRAVSSPFLPALSTPISKLVKAMRWVYNFDGVDDRAHLAFRAINPDGDIDIEFETGSSIPPIGSAKAIVDQSLTPTYSQKEFLLQLNGTGQMQVLHGGSYLTSNFNTVVEPGNTYRVTLIGNVLSYYKNGVATQVSNISRGSLREPKATTKIACSQVGAGSFAIFYLGGFKSIKINGVAYPTMESKQELQLPENSVFGPDIVDISSVIWDATSSSTSSSGGDLSYVAFDSWGQRPFRIPIRVQSDMPYLFEMDVVSGYSDGEAVRLILNDRLADGSPHVTPNSWPTTPATNFDISSPHYGSYVVIGRPLNGKVRGMFYIPNATNLDWFMSVRLAQTQNGRNIRLRNLSIRPLLTMSGRNLWSGRDLVAANAATVVTNISGSSWAVTRTGAAIPADAGRTGDFSSLEIGAMYMLTIESSSPIRLAVYDGAFALKESALANVLLFRASAVNKIYVCPNTQNSSVTVSNPRLFKVGTLCNPLQLINSNSDRWQEVSL